MSFNPRIPAWITDPAWRERLARWAAAMVAGFHRYAGWLVSLSWWRFVVYAIALLVGVAILTSMWPFTLRVTETIRHERPVASMSEASEAPDTEEAPEPDAAPSAVAKPPKPNHAPLGIRLSKQGVHIGKPGVEAAQVDISPQGIRIVTQPAPGASAPEAVLDIALPPEAAEALRRELERDAQGAEREAQKAIADAKRQVQECRSDAAEARAELVEARDETRVRTLRWGDFLQDIAWLWVLFSIVVKATYKGRKEAEAKAAAAEETAEAEALRRQLVEARLATMQAQVEPHFLFNTLASIDHLIETEPQRASRMQNNLIALLRATMPTMREANGQQSLRDLAREVAVVRPYLEILSVRMEERLQWRIDVPDGLMSAEFPPMVIQGLVENAIKHGLEPKPEGGSLVVSAHIEHGDLVVQVADTGLGFGRAATSGTGVGLANTRERLQLLYGNRASLTVSENQPCGTVVRIQVPYRSNHAPTSAAGG
ncbi:MAG: histidine kinase [Inhella sp.]|jgi:hypothetical protein|uniref:histidine kinase n=1 Tax=Inhella sp. TaxID=1921806 RepID=UPI0022CA4F50|nr:histidine kinase [Inhella sp.]MCZ8235654.1 histidine kinase [Inhella sp.]